MNVLVDTTVWSLALRRRALPAAERVLTEELAKLIREMRAVLIGPVRQEILSGIPDPRAFESVRAHLAAFDDLPVVRADYEEAARCFNECRKHGVQGSHIDFLICAVAKRHSAAIFTTDPDFAGYARHIEVALHDPGEPAISRKI